MSGTTVARWLTVVQRSHIVLARARQWFLSDERLIRTQRAKLGQQARLQVRGKAMVQVPVNHFDRSKPFYPLVTHYLAQLIGFKELLLRGICRY